MNRNTPILKDWYLLGLSTGMASAVVKTALNYAVEKAGVPTAPYGILAGNMVLGKREPRFWALHRPIRSRGERVVGYLADAVFGGIIGVAASYIYAKTPPGNEIVKGALGGAGVWAATFSIPNQMKVSRLKPAEMMTLLGMDIFFGALQGAMIGRLGAKLIQQSHPVLVKPVTNSQFNQGRLTTRGRQPSLM